MSHDGCGDYRDVLDEDTPDFGPSVEQMAQFVASGLWCLDCQCEFTKAHGEPVVCQACFNLRVELDIREVVTKATHEEATREAHRQRANKRKGKKNV